jgi:hypothetical protein
MLRGRMFSTFIMVMCSASTGVIQLVVTLSSVQPDAHCQPTGQMLMLGRVTASNVCPCNRTAPLTMCICPCLATVLGLPGAWPVRAV